MNISDFKRSDSGFWSVVPLSWSWSVAVAIGVIALGVIIYNLANPWHTYRYRLTVDLDVDGKSLSQSKIYQISKADSPLRKYFAFESGTEIRDVEGEALYFDLGAKPLVITLSGPSDSKGPTSVVVLAQHMLKVNDWNSPVLQEAMKKGTKVSVPIDKLPWMITFDDPADPNSVRLIDPDNLSAVFGRNVSVSSASLEMTTKRPSKIEIFQHLPWLRNIARPFPSEVTKSGLVITKTKPSFTKRNLVQ